MKPNIGGTGGLTPTPGDDLYGRLGRKKLALTAVAAILVGVVLVIIIKGLLSTDGISGGRSDQRTAAADSTAAPEQRDTLAERRQRQAAKARADSAARAHRLAEKDAAVHDTIVALTARLAVAKDTAEINKLSAELQENGVSEERLTQLNWRTGVGAECSGLIAELSRKDSLPENGEELHENAKSACERIPDSTVAAQHEIQADLALASWHEHEAAEIRSHIKGALKADPKAEATTVADGAPAHRKRDRNKRVASRCVLGCANTSKK